MDAAKLYMTSANWIFELCDASLIAFQQRSIPPGPNLQDFFPEILEMTFSCLPIALLCQNNSWPSSYLSLFFLLTHPWCKCQQLKSEKESSSFNCHTHLFILIEWLCHWRELSFQQVHRFHYILQDSLAELLTKSLVDHRGHCFNNTIICMLTPINLSTLSSVGVVFTWRSKYHHWEWIIFLLRPCPVPSSAPTSWPGAAGL